jgi:Flp pilus assembly protein TadG
MKRRVVPRRSRAEDGEVSVEAVIVFPLFLLMIFAVTQLSFAWYGRAALNGAAQDYLSVVQTNSTGQATYRDPASVATASVKHNAGFVELVSVTPSGLADGRVKVTIVGRVPAPFPGASRMITGTAVGTLDNFRPQGETTP